ncbi:MAG: PTS transporter subunit EIIC [Collinsella sp.]
MMQKIQRFGGAMYTPAILFAFSGIVVGLGTLFTTEAIFGEMATAGHLWFDCWNVLLQGGWTLFNQMPLLFCVALPISQNKQNARCCMEALAIYLTFNYFVAQSWGSDFCLWGRLLVEAERYWSCHYRKHQNA